MKEILQSSAQKEFHNLKSFFPTDIVTNTVNYTRGPFHDISQRKQFCMALQNPNRFHAQNIPQTFNHTVNSQLNTNELSFSFLRSQNSNRKHDANNFVTAKFPESFQRTFYTNESRRRKNNVYESGMEIDESRLNTLDTNDFKPQFASTPKRNDLYEFSRYGNQRCYNNTVTSSQKSVRNHKKKRQLEKKKIAKHLQRSKIDKEIKHKSFSGRFFGAINTSCTTLVKTVKNIFRPKSNLQEKGNYTDNDSLNKISKRDTMSCSYSFTEYMRRRDAALKDDCSNKPDDGVFDLKPKTNVEDFSMEMSNSCKTCNNTIALKRKLLSDEHLKKTIRKLKLGINLYGCNFKVPT